MILRTVEVDLERGQVRARGAEQLPDKAAALLTILPEAPDAGEAPAAASEAGLRRLPAAPGFLISRADLQRSLEADCYEQ